MHVNTATVYPGPNMFNKHHTITLIQFNSVQFQKNFIVIHKTNVIHNKGTSAKYD